MEVSPLPTPSVENWTEQFTATLHTQRQRVREFLSTQQERLRKAETVLSEELRQITAELADDRRQTRQAKEELAQRSVQIQQQAEMLEKMKADLAARQAEWEKLYRRAVEQQQSFADQLKQQQEESARQQQDLLQQQSAAVAAETQLQSERKEIESARAELERQQTQKDLLRDSLQTQQVELEKRQKELGMRAAETQSQRRRIARELKAQRAAHLKELEIRRKEVERDASADHSALQKQLESAQEECRILKAKPPAAANAADRREVERIEAEKAEMAARLADAEGHLAETRKQLTEAQAGSGKDADNGSEENESLRRRYEMSVEDLRELKAQKEELQQQLARSRQSGGGSPAQIPSSALNWEAEKQRILAALEADFEEDNEDNREEKLKIESVIHKTDQVLAGKNREIGELRELLSSQTDNIGTMAVGAAALGQILDNDAVVQEERKNLTRLQDECRDKLRQAEVDISLERAKIARERSQLEEKIRALEHQGVNLSTTIDEKEPAKPTRGRWLARLGLSDSEIERGK